LIVCKIRLGMINMNTESTAISVAQAFLDIAYNENQNLLNFKLQSLVVIANGIHIAAYKNSLICEDVKAWDFGPVIESLYTKLMPFGSGYVHTKLTDIKPSYLDSYSASQAIRATWMAYKSHTDIGLRDCLRIKGGPWDTVWNTKEGKYQVITDIDFYKYYSKRLKSVAG
jgi:uncharacterized phage-associated protein